MKHSIKYSLFRIIISALLIGSLSVTGNAVINSESQQTDNNPALFIMGDTDSDNKITASDARAVLRAVVGLESLAPEVYAYCDCNFNGVTDASDARIILRTAVGLESQQEHLFEFAELKASGCTGKGSFSAECKDCGMLIKGEIPVSKHIFDSGKLLSKPTVTEKATKTFICTVCGYEKNIKISYCDCYGHRWDIKSLGGSSVCGICNFTDKSHRLSQTEFSELLVNLTDNDEISKNLNTISGNYGSRWYTAYGNDQASRYIMNKLQSYGFTGNALIEDKFHVYGKELENIYAVIPTSVKNPDIVVISAHYDSVTAGRGAVDNATGVCSLLEIARIMKSTGADYGCEIRFCFFDGEEIGYHGAYRYCSYISQPEGSSPASIGRHKYILNLDMTGKPETGKDYYLCVSTEPVTKSYHRKAESNPTSDAMVKAKAIVGNCTEKGFYCPVAAGMHDLLPFRQNGLEGVTLSWRERAASANGCDYNLMAPTIIHTDADIVGNTDIGSLHKTTFFIAYSVAVILYDYYPG